MLTLLKNWYHRHFSQPGTIEFALVLAAIFVIIYYFMWLVGPLVVAVCLAYCLDWAVVALMRRANLSRHVSSIAVMIAFVGFALSLLVLLVPQIVRQGAQMYDSLVLMSQEVVSDHPLTDGQKRDLDTIITENVLHIAEDLPEPLPSMLSQSSVFNTVHMVRTQLTVYLVNLMRTQLMPSVVNIFTYLMYFVIVPIFTFLMLYSKEVLQRRVRIYLLPNNQVLMRHFWPHMSQQIESYIRGKILHVIIITIVNTAAFQVFGLNYAFLLGFGVGLSVVIPYVGAVLIAIPVIIVALLQFGLSGMLFWLLLVYLIIQLLDSNFLTPMLFSKSMNLDAFSILAAILIFGGLWGFWGVFFAIPLATFIKTLIVGWPSADRRVKNALNAPDAQLNAHGGHQDADQEGAAED